MELLDQPLRTAEFVALDVETNGRVGEECELTEVGAVLVGGGELHDRWGSLVGVTEPLGRGIQRFTGITQAMVDEAPPPETVLPELAHQLTGRIFVAHSARATADCPAVISTLIVLIAPLRRNSTACVPGVSSLINRAPSADDRS